MTKNELICAAAQETKLPKRDVDAVVNAMLGRIIEELRQGNEVRLPNFGIFEVKERAARNVWHIHARKSVPVPLTRHPAFRAGKAFRDAVK